MTRGWSIAGKQGVRRRVGGGWLHLFPGCGSPFSCIPRSKAACSDSLTAWTCCSLELMEDGPGGVAPEKSGGEQHQQPHLTCKQMGISWEQFHGSAVFLFYFLPLNDSQHLFTDTHPERSLCRFCLPLQRALQHRWVLWTCHQEHLSVRTLDPPLVPGPLSPFLVVSTKARVSVCARSVVSNSFVTPWTIARRLLWPWDVPGKNTGVGCHFLLQGIFLTQGSNLRLLWLLYWQAGYLSPSPKTATTSFKTQRKTSSGQRHNIHSCELWKNTQVGFALRKLCVWSLFFKAANKQS